MSYYRLFFVLWLGGMFAYVLGFVIGAVTI